MSATFYLLGGGGGGGGLFLGRENSRAPHPLYEAPLTKDKWFKVTVYN